MHSSSLALAVNHCKPTGFSRFLQPLRPPVTLCLQILRKGTPLRPKSGPMGVFKDDHEGWLILGQHWGYSSVHEKSRMAHPTKKRQKTCFMKASLPCLIKACFPNLLAVLNPESWRFFTWERTWKRPDIWMDRTWKILSNDGPDLIYIQTSREHPRPELRLGSRNWVFVGWEDWNCK